MLLNSIPDTFQSRKFFLTLLSAVTFTVLLIVGKIQEPAYVNLMEFALGGYLLVNAGQAAVGKISDSFGVKKNDS